MSISRRHFVESAGVAVAGAYLGPLLHHVRAPDHDIIVRGGTVFDGSGRAGREADVAIAHGKVRAVQRRIRARASLEIDGRGLAVAPGFIDIHSHADDTLFDDPRLESVVRQGVTTVVVGQDGSSRFPVNAADSGRTFASVRDFFTAIDALPAAANIATMVGLGTLREIVVGEDDRPATPEELRRMVQMVQDALDAGACGASSGLEYTPGAFAPRDELVALCRPLAHRGLCYATHMRNEDDRLLEAIDEAIAVARGARCRLQVSHLKTEGVRNWPKLDAVFARIADARKDHLDVAFDRYPYTAYQTGLTNLLPVSALDGGTDKLLARLADSSELAKIREGTLAKVELIGGWDNVMISGVRAPEDKAAEGQRLGTYSQQLGVDPFDQMVHMLQRNRADIGIVGFAMSEQNLERILAHPQGMVCSDGGAFAIEGPARRGHPHPRGLGTFPRVLGHYVRERKVFPLETAIHKMTALPASRLGLHDRGRLAVGAAADVVVFDPATIDDRATYTDPFQYPAGISAVIVNGAVAVRDGEHTGASTGTAVRPG
ncbi:MAG TPA: D-aminoacylase [Gemmatimonadaceae bacterium]|nr:D-aminoacylase [Gemmatimonadaceae bacterium]